MNDAKNILKKNKLRPTIQRVAIVEYIIEKHKVHITASKLLKYLKNKKINISLATIYNNLNELSIYVFDTSNKNLKRIEVVKADIFYNVKLKNLSENFKEHILNYFYANKNYKIYKFKTKLQKKFILKNLALDKKSDVKKLQRNSWDVSMTCV